MGLVLISGSLLTRASVGSTTLPSWDMDPLVFALPVTVLTPAGSLFIDAVILFGAALLFLRAALNREQIDRLPLLLGAIGALPILLHGWGGWLLGPEFGAFGDQRIGASWLSAIAAALALSHAARDPRIRRVVAASILGFFILLALRALQQELIDHPQTIADFKQNRDRILAAHGWTPGSSSALSFERRALQAEATGWFGLSNVFASLAAAGVVATAGLLLARSRAIALPGDAPQVQQSPNPLPTLALLTTLAACTTSLALSRSKGGILAAAAGLGALIVLHVLNRRARTHPNQARILAGLLGPLAILAPIALVLLRGALGDHLSELSLLFRSFYLRGATSIFLHHPAYGVGPDGFQNAYLTAKPALSTEDVTSPHSIVFDYAATLGVLGLAWVALLFRWAWLVGANALPNPHSETHDPQSPPISRNELRFLALLPAVVTIAAAYTDTPLITPDLAALRIVGALLWGLAAWGIVHTFMLCSPTSTRIALAAAALAILAHAQIDVALSWPQTAGIITILIALAAARSSPEGGGMIVRQHDRGGGSGQNNNPLPHTSTPPTPKSSIRELVSSPLLPTLTTAALSLLLLSAALPAFRWQRTLTQAAELLHPIADFNARLAQPVPPDSPDRIARELSALLNTQVQPTQSSIHAALAALEVQRLPIAAHLLVKARLIEPSDHRPLREASRLHLRLAESATSRNAPEAASHLDRALEVLPKVNDRLSSADYRWAALILDRRARLTNYTNRDFVRAADTAYQTAASADPTNPDIPLRLMRLHAAAGDHEQARRWAEETLRRNALQRYDPTIRALNESDRAEVERILRSPPHG